MLYCCSDCERARRIRSASREAGLISSVAIPRNFNDMRLEHPRFACPISGTVHSGVVVAGVPAPMLARLESTLPRGPEWRYEPKLDGFRGLLWRSNTRAVRVLSRNLKDLSV